MLNGKPNKLITVITGLFLITIIACGSGGTETPQEPEQPVPTVDTVAPTILSISPSDGEQNILLNTEIRVLFSEDMDSSTISDESFELSLDGNLVGFTVSFDTSNRTAILTPNEQLQILETYVVTLSSDITDIAGNSIVGHRSEFVTRDLTWQTPNIIEAKDGRAEGVDVAYFENDSAIAVWSQLENGRYNIYTNSLLENGEWQSPELLENMDMGNAGVLTGSGTEGGLPKIATDGTGKAVAVWSQNDGTRANIYYSHFDSTAG